MRRRANPWHLAAAAIGARVRIVALEASGDRAAELAASLITHQLLEDPREARTACQARAYRRRVAATRAEWDALPPSDIRCDGCEYAREQAR